MSFWRRPQATLARRVIFQIHVWTGVTTGVYALFIGLTGALLMFRPELQAGAYPQFFSAPREQAPLADPAVIIAELERTFPGGRFSGIDYPSDRRATFLAYVSDGSELRTVFLDPATGRVRGELPRDGWIQQLQELHFTFLLGSRGYVINGLAAACLLAMCLTGLVIWWPGIARVGQACVVHFGRGWKRVIWELHGAAGIWTIALLVMWAVSGIYFSFPVPFRAGVARVAALTPYVSKQSGPPSDTVPPRPAALVQRAQARVPGAQVARLMVPSGERGTYGVVLARVRHGDGDSTDEVTVYFDRYTGAELGVSDQSGRTAGDIFLTWLGRLHVGNFGGWPIKILWFAGGVVFPLLFLTGIVMWWNRFVRPAMPTRTVAAGR